MQDWRSMSRELRRILHSGAARGTDAFVHSMCTIPFQDLTTRES